MTNHTAIISGKAVERIRAGHLWIYRSDVLDCGAEPGAVVSVTDRKGRFLGKAFYSAASLIALRLLSREDQPIDRKFWIQRFHKAWELRQRVVSDSEVYRLVHAPREIERVAVVRISPLCCLKPEFCSRFRTHW